MCKESLFNLLIDEIYLLGQLNAHFGGFLWGWGLFMGEWRIVDG